MRHAPTSHAILAAAIVAALAGPAGASGGRVVPPPASANVDGATRTLAIGSYCWRNDRLGTCQREKPRRGPLLRLGAGDEVRFELGFTPRALRVTVAGRTMRLASRRRSTWTVPAGLPDRARVRLEARGRRGSVTYFATAVRD